MNLSFRSLDQFLNAWYNAPEAVAAVNERQSLKEAKEISAASVDREHLRKVHRHLLAMLEQLGLDTDIFKDPKNGYYMVKNNAVEDFFTYLLQIPKAQAKLIRNGKFEKLPPELLIEIRTCLLSMLQDLHWSKDQIREQKHRYAERTGCPRKIYAELVQEAANAAALALQRKNKENAASPELLVKYFFWPSNSKEVPPHTPFSDDEWKHIMDLMQAGYSELKELFIQECITYVCDVAYKDKFPDDDSSKS